MLEFLRRAVRSWVAKALLGLLVVSFAVWGVGDIARGLSPHVATVGDKTISADLYARALRRQLTRFGLDPSQIRSSGLDRFVLASLARDAAFAEAAREMGVSAPDSAVARRVRRDPAFQVAGEFDPVAYESNVRRAFGSVGVYEETIRDAIAANLLRSAAAQAVAPDGAGALIARFRAETRRFDAIEFDADAIGVAIPEPTDADLQAHLEDNAAAFRAPERRDVTWLHVDPAALAAGFRPSEEALRAAYKDRRAEFVTEPTRTIDQIVFDDESAARAAADAIAAGETDFDALLAERGLSRADAALGSVTRDELPDARADAAFGLETPGVAGPVRIPTGWALLEVTAVTPGAETPFDEARDTLAAELALEQARPEADRLAEEVADLRAAGATLEEIAAEFDLPLGSVDGLAADGTLAAGGRATGLAAAPVFLDEAFAAAEGEERSLIDAPAGGYFELRVDAIAEPQTPPLVEIRDRVAADWRAARRREALREAAEAARERVADGEPLADVAADLGVEPFAIGPLRREDSDPRLSAEAREALFAGAEGATAVSVRRGRAVVAEVAEIAVPPEAEEEAEAFAQALAQSLSQDQVELFGRALEAEIGVTFNPQTYDSVVSQIGG